MKFELWHDLDRLYLGDWALRLIAVCEHTAHDHQGTTCGSPGKRPLESRWPQLADERSAGCASREKHIERIARHLEQAGNIGLAVPPGVIVLDADCSEAQAWLETTLGDSPCQHTKKGAHFVCRLPSGLKLKNATKVCIADGVEVDLRGYGSQIVVQPSEHASGAKYRWIRCLPEDLSKLPELPGRIADALAKQARSAASTGSAATDSSGPILAGNRNDELTRIAGRARRNGRTSREIEELLLCENAARCEPPLEEAEVMGIARSIARYRSDKESGTTQRCTDMGNARRLIDDHGEDLFYCADASAWFTWTGKRWELDGCGEVERRAKSTIRGIFDEAANARSDLDAKALGKHALSSQSHQRILAMVRQSRSEKEVATLSSQFDANPDVLNVENGTLNLTNYRLQKHRREDLLTKMAPVRYEEGARSKIWDAFLADTFPDPELRRYVQKVAGYALSGRADLDVFFILYGPSRSGKGCFLEALRSVLGDGYAVTLGISDLAQRHRHEPGPRPELARLKGGRVALSFEASSRAGLSSSVLKSIAGSDRITARHLHKEPIEFQPQCTVFLASNYRPSVPDDDDALWERIREIPFREQVPEDKRDPGLRRALREDPAVRSAVLAWQVEGLRMVRAEGLKSPDSVLEAVAAYRRDMDPLSDFIDECCHLGDLNGGSYEATRDVFDEYQRWCKPNGREPISLMAMVRRLQARGCISERGKIRGRRRRILKGIALVPLAER